MAWYDDPLHPFAGIWEKLKRADDNIVNLGSVSLAFLENSKYPVMPDEDSKEWQDAVNYHSDLRIPPLFGVLTGEIVHHFRSCLDHVVWHFSTPQYRLEAESAIEFPVYREEPIGKDKVARFERKIKGITKSSVRDLIMDAQPYKRGSSAADDPICIIHDMDRFDKHRELVIVMGCVGMAFPSDTPDGDIQLLLQYGQGKSLSGDDLRVAKRTFKKRSKVTPQIAFAKFGDRETQLVVPSLSQLSTAVSDLINLFASEV